MRTVLVLGALCLTGSLSGSSDAAPHKPGKAMSKKSSKAVIVQEDDGVDPETRKYEAREARNNAERDALPTPPSEDPAAYKAWLNKLPRAMQVRVNRFCRNNPTQFEASCGGIGPLHIPVPPSMMPRMRAPEIDPSGELIGAVEPEPEARFTREDWHKSLTREQSRYVERWCASELNAYSQLCGATPLVVAFDNQPVAYRTDAGRFAFLPGDPLVSDWPTATTPWIARDVDGNGRIESGAELFGGNTVLPGQTTAANGFLALAPLDSNRDGVLDANDPEFASLVLWADRDGDRRSTPDELRPLAETITSISLAYTTRPHCDARGNCERERSTITFRDGGALRTGSVVDVHLPLR